MKKYMKCVLFSVLFYLQLWSASSQNFLQDLSGQSGQNAYNTVSQAQQHQRSISYQQQYSSYAPQYAYSSQQYPSFSGQYPYSQPLSSDSYNSQLIPANQYGLSQTLQPGVSYPSSYSSQGVLSGPVPIQDSSQTFSQASYSSPSFPTGSIGGFPQASYSSPSFPTGSISGFFQAPYSVPSFPTGSIEGFPQSSYSSPSFPTGSIEGFPQSSYSSPSFPTGSIEGFPQSSYQSPSFPTGSIEGFQSSYQSPSFPTGSIEGFPQPFPAGQYPSPFGSQPSAPEGSYPVQNIEQTFPPNAFLPSSLQNIPGQLQVAAAGPYPYNQQFISANPFQNAPEKPCPLAQGNSPSQSIPAGVYPYAAQAVSAGPYPIDQAIPPGGQSIQNPSQFIPPGSYPFIPSGPFPYQGISGGPFPPQAGIPLPYPLQPGVVSQGPFFINESSSSIQSNKNTSNVSTSIKPNDRSFPKNALTPQENNTNQVFQFPIPNSQNAFQYPNSLYSPYYPSYPYYAAPIYNQSAGFPRKPEIIYEEYDQQGNLITSQTEFKPYDPEKTQIKFDSKFHKSGNRSRFLNSRPVDNNSGSSSVRYGTTNSTYINFEPKTIRRQSSVSKNSTTTVIANAILTPDKKPEVTVTVIKEGKNVTYTNPNSTVIVNVTNVVENKENITPEEVSPIKNGEKSPTVTTSSSDNGFGDSEEEEEEEEEEEDNEIDEFSDTTKKDYGDYENDNEEVKTINGALKTTSKPVFSIFG